MHQHRSASAPSLCAAYWAIRGMAPICLVLAGAAAGLFAGAIAASAYALRCTEMELPFLVDGAGSGSLIQPGHSRPMAIRSGPSTRPQ